MCFCGGFLLDCFLNGIINIPPELDDVGRSITPVGHDLLQLCIGKVQSIAAHSLHCAHAAAVTAGKLRYFTFLPQVTVDAMLHDRNTEHL